MTVTEAQQLKNQLQADIAAKCMEFTEATGITIDGIYLQPVRTYTDSKPAGYRIEVEAKL